MPRVEPKVEEGILVLFADDVAEQASHVVERLREEGFQTTTEQELWRQAPIGTPTMLVVEDAVARARKVVVIPSSRLLASNISTTIMYMAISCGKAVPAIVSDVAFPLSLSTLSAADLRPESAERYMEEMERLIRSLGKKEDQMPRVLRPANEDAGLEHPLPGVWLRKSLLQATIAHLGYDVMY